MQARQSSIASCTASVTCPPGQPLDALLSCPSSCRYLPMAGNHCCRLDDALTTCLCVYLKGPGMSYMTTVCTFPSRTRAQHNGLTRDILMALCFCCCVEETAKCVEDCICCPCYAYCGPQQPGGGVVVA